MPSLNPASFSRGSPPISPVTVSGTPSTGASQGPQPEGAWGLGLDGPGGNAYAKQLATEILAGKQHRPEDIHGAAAEAYERGTRA